MRSPQTGPAGSSRRSDPGAMRVRTRGAHAIDGNARNACMRSVAPRESSAAGKLARLNMPLELGMAMAKRFMDLSDGHDWLSLVPKGHAYLRFVSDLAAYDPATHDGSVQGIVVAVMAWLATRKDAISRVTPRE